MEKELTYKLCVLNDGEIFFTHKLPCKLKKGCKLWLKLNMNNKHTTNILIEVYEHQFDIFNNQYLIYARDTFEEGLTIEEEENLWDYLEGDEKNCTLLENPFY